MDKFTALKRSLDMAIAISEYDAEAAHGDADDILCNVARAAAANEIDSEQTEQLINAWDQVRKWYA